MSSQNNKAKSKTLGFGLIALAATGLILLFSSAFIVSEGRQAIITEFGKPVGKPITESGLHFKKPFFQAVTFVDKRILSWDGFPNQIPTKDKKYIMVDTTARWRIIDALKFIQSVQNERGAKARLDSILDANTRDIISKNNLVEAVRNTNQILEKKEALDKKAKEEDAADTEPEIIGEIEPVNLGREKLSQQIVENSAKELRDLGMALVDVQFTRISYERSVEDKVYERMISERQRIAEKIRSIGKGEKAKIEGRLAKDLETIRSEGYRKAQEIKGKAEGKSIAIYAKAFKKDPSFYEFVRTLEAYKKSFGGDQKNARFILSSESEFLRTLKRN